MGMVQIDEADLATLRSDRDKARDELAEVKRDLTAKAEQAEGDATREKERADKAEKEKSDLQESAQRAQLKSSRWDALGTGFVAKLGEVTKAGLQESASTLSDEDWNKRLIEIEEMSGLKRDATADAAAAAKDGKDGKDDGKETDTASAFNAESFTPEELAKFGSSGVASPSRPASSGTAARSLARALKPSRPKAEATK